MSRTTITGNAVDTARVARLTLLLGFMLLTGCSSQADSSEPTRKQLRFKHCTGQVFKCTNTTREVVAGEIQGREVEFVTETEKTEIWTVRSVDVDGTSTIHKRTNRFKFATSQVLDGREIGRDEYDSASEKPVTGDLAIFVPNFEEMLNAEIEIKADNRGKTLSATPLTGRLAGQPTSECGGGAMMFVFPEEPILPGHEWKETIQRATPFGALSAVVTLTYEGPEDRDGAIVERILLSSETTLPGRQDAPVTSCGTILFDSELGQLVEISTETTDPSPKVAPSLKNATETITERRVWTLVSEGTDMGEDGQVQPSSQAASEPDATDDEETDRKLFEQMLLQYPEYNMEAARNVRSMITMLGGEVSDDMMELVRKRAAVEVVLREAKIRMQVAGNKLSKLAGTEPDTPLYPDESSRMAQHNYDCEHNSALTMRVQAMKHVAEARKLAEKTLPKGDPMFDKIDVVERAISPEATRVQFESNPAADAGTLGK